MKKVISCVIAAVMSLSLVACGGNKSGASNESEQKIMYSNGGPVEFFVNPMVKSRIIYLFQGII